MDAATIAAVHGGVGGARNDGIVVANGGAFEIVPLQGEVEGPIATHEVPDVVPMNVWVLVTPGVRAGAGVRPHVVDPVGCLLYGRVECPIDGGGIHRNYELGELYVDGGVADRHRDKVRRRVALEGRASGRPEVGGGPVRAAAGGRRAWRDDGWVG